MRPLQTTIPAAGRDEEFAILRWEDDGGRPAGREPDDEPQKTAAVTKELAAMFAALNRKHRLEAWARLVQMVLETVRKIDAGVKPSYPVAGPPTPPVPAFAALPATVVAELARSAAEVAPVVARLPYGDRLRFGTELARQLIEQVDDYDGEATRAIDRWRRAGRGFASGSSSSAASPRRATAR